MSEHPRSVTYLAVHMFHGKQRIRPVVVTTLLLASMIVASLAFVTQPTRANALLDEPTTTIVVDSLSDLPDTFPADGICSTDGAGCTLRAAIETAQGGALPGPDIIDLGGLSGTIFVTFGPLPAITEDLTISGPLDADTLVINAIGESRHFSIGSGVTVEIARVHLTRGFGDDGGAIYNAGSLTLTGVIISDSLAAFNGGAIYNVSSLTLTGVSISGSSAASDGGAIYGAAGSTTTIGMDSQIGRLEFPNSADYGGAIYIDSSTLAPSTLIIDDSSVFFNGATFNGGGIYNYGGTVTIENHSGIEGNGAGDYGGGIYNVASGVVKIVNSTISDNSAGADGGGIYSYYSTQTLVNTTITGNRAHGAGGGIAEVSTDTAFLYNVTVTDNIADSDSDGSGDGGGLFAQGIINISNSILAGNEDFSTGSAPVHPDCTTGPGTSFSTNINNLVGIDLGCAAFFVNGVSGNQVGTAASPLDPVLSGLTYDPSGAVLHTLLAGSPAIDTGDPTGCKDDTGALLLEDQRGMSRPQNVVCDIGAYEAAWPIVDDQDFSIDESSPNGTEVGTVVATANAGGSLAFAITGGNGTGAGTFAIGDYSGILTVADSSQLNYTVNPVFDLGVVVTNSIGLTDTAVMTIDVIPDPLIVRNTNDTGSGSLRNAMEFADSQVGLDAITFDIPGTGPHVITPTSSLPFVFADPVTIDGLTQPAGPVVIDGSLAGPDVDGFTIFGYGSTIRGLTIKDFSGAGVYVDYITRAQGIAGVLIEENTITGNGEDGVVAMGLTAQTTIRSNSIYDNGLLGIDLGGDGVTPNDVGDTDGGPNGSQNFPVLLRAYPGKGGIAIEGRLNSLPITQTYTLEFFRNPTCDASWYGQGEILLGTYDVETNGAGNAMFSVTILGGVPEGQFVTATATDPFGNTSEFSQCIVTGPANDVWPRALRLEPTPEGTVLTATASQYLDILDQSRWYKFQIEPGSKVTVDLENLPSNYDLTLYKDIRAAYDAMTNPQDTGDLNQLNAEFAPDAWTADAWSPDAWTSDAWSPDAWTPDAWTPDAWTPDAWTPDAWTPDAWTPDAWTPDAWTPDTFSPDAWTPDAWTPDPAYSSAQLRTLIAVSGLDGTASERVVANTWSNVGDFYIRVRGRNGAFNLNAPFTVKLRLETDICENIDTTLVPPSLNATAGNYRTIILTDLARTPGSPATIAQLQAKLAQLAARNEVDGVVVDVNADARVAAANVQADARPECPPAKNLVADSIKEIINRYRSVNPLEYVVLVGADEVIPFFRHPDHSLLANEANYVPPVKNDSASQASLRLGYVLSQDRYGSRTDVSYKSYVIPVPDLAVGRLVETADDMSHMIDVYLSTGAGVVDTPTTSMVSGYDFLEDAALAVKAEFESGIGNPAQALLAPRTALPTDPESWNADQLRAMLLGSRHDIIYLAGHFSASTALAADYQTRLLTTDVTSSTVNMVNSIVFSGGCHSGYNIVNQAGIPLVTREPDWAQAFAQKGATLIGGTGYQYGDTDFIEYSERLYAEFSRQLRIGFGPVSVGKALAAAKLDYLARTPEMRGIHEKAVLEATLFGLPMISIDMPQGRGNPPADPSIVTDTSGFPTNPGSSLGLVFADVEITPDLITHTKVLTNASGVGTVTTTYLSGSDGIVTNPGELVFPLEFPNVSLANMSLRGVGFRGGAYADLENIIPLTGAAVTELRGMHPPFQPEIYFPALPWQVNYFDVLADPAAGVTRLAVLPAQFRAEGPTTVEGTLRSYDQLDFRLYYSDNLSLPGRSRSKLDTDFPALAAPPTISQVTSITGTNQVDFSVTVIGDPVAGVQEVWVVYTGVAGDLYGRWQALDLTQDTVDSKVWNGTLALVGTNPQDVRFLVQAVNGVGLVATMTNMGAYFIGGVDPGATSPNAEVTTLTLLAPPATGTYATEGTFTALLEGPSVLANHGSAAPVAPVPGQIVTFALGGQQRVAVTGLDGRATAVLPLMAPTGPNAVKVSFAGSTDYVPSSSSSAFTIVKQPTQLAIMPQPAQGQYSDVVELSATLTDGLNRALREKTIFLVAGIANPSKTIPSITNYNGQTVPEPLFLPAGLYPLTAYFMGVIPVGNGATVELEDRLYASSLRNGTLTIVAENATVTYTGAVAGYDNQPLHAAAQVTQEDDGTPGDLTKAKVRYMVTDSNNQVVADVQGDVAANGASAVDISGLPAGMYHLTVQVVGGFFTSPVSAPVAVTISSPTAVRLAGFATQTSRPEVATAAVAALALGMGVLLVIALKRRTINDR